MKNDKKGVKRLTKKTYIGRFRRVSYMASWGVKAAFIFYLFYQSIVVTLIATIAASICGWCRGKVYIKTLQRERIQWEFREMLQGISAALQAGYSMENALKEAEKDLHMLYGKESILRLYIRDMEQQIQLNQPVEEVFKRFAEVVNLEDVHRFSQTLQIAKRTGGDLIGITRMTAERMSEKWEVQREIHSVIAGKQMEAKIMQIIPLAMIVYFHVCSPGFLDVLYQGGGRLVMTILLGIYGIAYYWILRISHIVV